jgi:dTDP-4-dehydrorhamnose reductase
LIPAAHGLQAETAAAFPVAVIGASGLLGRAVAAAARAQPGWRVLATGRQRLASGMEPLDVTDAVAVAGFFARHRPAAVVLAAAERRPDVCEREPARANALNVDAVAEVARCAARHGAWVLNISTDYVFDGTAPPYGEDATPTPVNAYGRSKLAGERALRAATALGCSLRLPLLYGPVTHWSESAVTALVPAVRNSAVVASMDAWATRYPTLTTDVAVVVTQMLELARRAQPVCGIAHWSAAEPMTKYDIALRLARALGVGHAHLLAQLEPVDATPRPRDCHLDSTRLETLGIGRRTRLDDALPRVLAASMPA